MARVRYIKNIKLYLGIVDLVLSLCVHPKKIFFLSMILNLNCFYSIFVKKRNGHSHFKYIKMHQLKVAIMLLSSQKYFISIEIETSAIVIVYGLFGQSKYTTTNYMNEAKSLLSQHILWRPTMEEILPQFCRGCQSEAGRRLACQPAYLVVVSLTGCSGWCATMPLLLLLLLKGWFTGPSIPASGWVHT